MCDIFESNPTILMYNTDCTDVQYWCITTNAKVFPLLSAFTWACAELSLQCMFWKEMWTTAVCFINKNGNCYLWNKNTWNGTEAVFPPFFSFCYNSLTFPPFRLNNLIIKAQNSQNRVYVADCLHFCKNEVFSKA